MEQKSVAVIVIIVRKPDESAEKVNKILSENGDIVIARLGVPYPKRELCIINLVVDGSNDRIGAITGKIGQIPNVTVKTTFAKL